MLISSVTQMIDIMKSKQYRVYLNDKQPYNLNIIGVRSVNSVPNQFDDWMFVFWRYHGEDVLKQYRITTDPGLYYLKNPMNVNGTAILPPGQYANCFKIGLHNGKYEALVQAKPITVIRDFNRDGKLDFDSARKDTGMFGINIHRAGEDSQTVDRWSAGCQVFQRMDEFEEFMEDCRKARDIWGNSFTYTLLEEADFGRKEVA